MEKTEKLKTCNDCGETKEPTAFTKDKRRADGLNPYCRDCTRARSKAYNKTAAGRESTRKAQAKWRKANPEKAKAAEEGRDYSKMLAKNARYRAGKDQRTPAWADQEAIAYVYHAAQVIKEVYGTAWHVDHIIPLHGENVSGLHVANNLQLLSPRDNINKSNRW